MTKVWRVFVGLTAIAAIAMCARDRFKSDAGDESQSTARVLGIYGLDRAGDLQSEARAALERDARRREHRFLDAIKPGHLLSATRVEQRAIDLGQHQPAELYELGAQLFHHRFLQSEGFGAQDLPHFGRVHKGARGGPDAHRCADCHRRGGIAGAGAAVDNVYLDGDGDTPQSALERNPPPLHGAGVVELLGREMSSELQRRRDDLVADAKQSGQARSLPLAAKGVSFGELGAAPDGKLDMSRVRGVARDLVVRPFGHKGHAASLREVVEDELLIHHGMQTTHLAAHGQAARVGAFGLPDPDGDGVRDEVSEGQLTALTVFLAMQEIPQVGMPRRAEIAALWSDGQKRFADIGCARCHTPSLPLESTVYELESRKAGGKLRIDLAQHGGAPRIAAPASGGGYRVYLFSDLKRHVMGPRLRQRRGYRGVSPSEFITPPLWGIARSGPYMHDGRAPTLERAILEHDGEATDARSAYQKLGDRERAPIRIYLMSMTRERRIVAP